ncbi:MAG: hypothetical protein WBI18_10980 [Candidatus Saccharicenans sp.]
MAKQVTRKKSGVEFKGYLRVNLTEEQDKHFDEWFPSQVIQISDFGILCNNGFKFALAWDNFHQGVVASLYANDPKLSWSGWILTAWADSAEESVALLFYKHYIVCEEDWEHFQDAVEKSGRTRG